MNPADPQVQNKPGKSRLYFTVAVLLLILMALLWSVDASFIYISLGGAIFFFFLAFLNRPRQITKDPPRQASYQRETRRQQQSQGADLVILLKSFFSRQTSSPAKTARVIAAGISMFTFVIFFLIIVMVIFADDETYSETDNFQKAEQFRWNAEYDSADFYYRNVLTQNPAHLEALMGYGNSFLAQEKYDSAIAVFGRALEAYPDYDEARYGKALGHHYRRDYRQSLAESLRIVESNPDYGNAVVLAADNYYVQQRYDSAIYWYENAYQSENRSAWLCHVMAYIYDVKGNQQKAISLYRESLSYDSFRTDIYVRLGELFPGKDGEVYRKTARDLKAQGY